jgi:hypothetical protein
LRTSSFTIYNHIYKMVQARGAWAEIPTEVPAEIPAEVPAEIPAEIPAEVPAEIPAEIPAHPGQKGHYG